MTRFLSWWFRPISARSWAEYWFSPGPVFDLAVCRIIMVATQLALVLFYVNYSNERFESYAGLDHDLFMAIPTLKVLLLPFGLDFRPDAALLLLVKYAAVISGIFALAGFLTNVSLAVFVYANLVMITHFYSYSDFHHTEAPLMLALVYLTLSPAGGVLSVDRLLRGKGLGRGGVLEEASPYARWPILLAQWTFALVYLSAFLEKLVFIGGLDWLNGFTLQYAVANDTLRRGTLLGEWLQQHWWALLLGQYLTVAFQGTFWVSLVFPRLKLLYVPLGFGFHLLILVALNAKFFEWMGTYAIFVPWAVVATFMLARLGTRAQLPLATKG
jgi:hypothetical protein